MKVLMISHDYLENLLMMFQLKNETRVVSLEHNDMDMFFQADDDKELSMIKETLLVIKQNIKISIFSCNDIVSIVESSIRILQSIVKNNN